MRFRTVRAVFGSLVVSFFVVACSDDAEPSGRPVHEDAGITPSPDAGVSDSGTSTVALPFACDAVTAALSLADVEITAAVAAPGTPSHCVVSGRIGARTGTDGKPYAIGFELRLPAEWNRRFFFQGGAGTDGFVLPALGALEALGTNALSLGYAVVSTDGGHTTQPTPVGGAAFGLEPRARTDYGYGAVGTVTRTAKQIVERLYSSPIRYSYFMGCSNGGRQAMVAAARFAEEFDGIVAGDPGFNLPKAAIQHAWNVQQLNRVDADNSLAFTAGELELVASRIRAECDALDGATDGIVADFQGCKASFDLDAAVPACEGERDGSCLTETQKDVLSTMMRGPTNGKGEALYAAWPWDPGLSKGSGFGDWRTWNLGTTPNNALIRTLGGGALAYIFTTPPVDLEARGGSGDLVGDFLSAYDFDTDAPKIAAVEPPYDESALGFMTPPGVDRLEAFRERRGKLIVYHGASDAVFSLLDTVRWYEELAANVNASDFVRLYPVPGMGHCGGGVGTDVFDVMTPLVEWVERNVAPRAIEARVDPDSPNLPAEWSKTRSRPLCPYPQKAILARGATDLESASSFVCE